MSANKGGAHDKQLLGGGNKKSGDGAGTTTADKEEGAATIINPEDLWYVHGKAYDLMAFVPSHPGKQSSYCYCQPQPSPVS